MSLTIYNYKCLVDDSSLPKNTFYIKKPERSTIIERVYTSTKQRRMTNIREGSVISIPDETGIIIFLNGKIIDYCDIPGNYVFSKSITKNNVKDAILEGSLARYITELEENLVDTKFKEKEFHVYSINTGIISSDIFSINNPVTFNDAVYGHLQMRYYGKNVVRISNPLQLLTLMLKNKIEVCSFEQIFKDTRYEFIGNLSQTLSEISLKENISFIKLPEIQGEISEKMIEKMKNNWEGSMGISLLSVQMISMLPTVESRELIENKINKARKFNEIVGNEKRNSYLNIH